MNRALQVCAPLTGWGARGAWLTVAVAVAAVALAVGAAPAAAAQKCPSNPTVLPDSNSNPPYQCAEMHSSSKTKLKPWATKSWTSSPGLGYSEKTTCSWKDNKNVTIVPAYGVGSYTSTGTNWAVSNSHHFAAGILWATGTGHVDGEGYSSGCADGDEDGHIKNSILNRDSLALNGVPSSATVGQPVTLTASLSPSDASGTVVLLQDSDSDAPVPVALGALQAARRRSRGCRLRLARISSRPPTTSTRARNRSATAGFPAPPPRRPAVGPRRSPARTRSPWAPHRPRQCWRRRQPESASADRWRWRAPAGRLVRRRRGGLDS